MQKRCYTERFGDSTEFFGFIASLHLAQPVRNEMWVAKRINLSSIYNVRTASRYFSIAKFKFLQYYRDNTRKFDAGNSKIIEAFWEIHDTQFVSKLSLIPERYDSRRIVFDKVKNLQIQGITRRKIAKDLGISRNTVRSYFIQDELTPKAHPKRTNIELFSDHIISRIQTKGHVTQAIIEEIRKMWLFRG